MNVMVLKRTHTIMILTITGPSKRYFRYLKVFNANALGTIDALKKLFK